MPSQKNVQLLQEAKERVDRAAAIFFADYQGVTHKQLEEARREIRKIGGEIAISKNNLINIALNEKNVDAKDRLQGPLAAFFAYGDPVAVASTLHNFFKKNFDASKIKFGVYEGKILEDKDVITLASLPSREVLLGQLVGLLKGPLNGLVYALNYNTSKLVYALKEIEKKKGSN